MKDTYPNVQSGVRPCLIVQNNIGNTYSSTIIVVPITTKIKKTNMPVHVVIEHGSSPKQSYEMVLCECILTVSKSQIKNYLRKVNDSVMNRVNKALKISLELELIGGGQNNQVQRGVQ